MGFLEGLPRVLPIVSSSILERDLCFISPKEEENKIGDKKTLSGGLGFLVVIGRGVQECARGRRV